MPKTCFVYERPGLDTSEIRGRQIAGALECDTVRFADLTEQVAARYDVLVYVKKVPEPKLMERIARVGVKQVADPLDNYSWKPLHRAKEHLDAFIAANRTHGIFLSSTFGRPAVAIPHHHCNFDELRIPAGRRPTLGYIGGRDHLPASRKAVKGLRHPVVLNTERRDFDDLIRTYLGIDLGFAFRTDPDKIRYNCSQKLVNFMSFGIPSVFNPESGYMEVSRHGEFCMYAHTPGEMRMVLEELAGDDGVRRRMGDAAYEAARPFHIREVAKQYRDFLDGL
jgi:hypothetical protein